eukprot:TRINITY_DN4275_c0_g1_i1.p1 TRINITY_DN4275_c0_g1~~TRINITY_DN4275_c0_g1_i1.p1  ORF type:complete len:1415 (+),score=245.00 TRINITY_DN4275_c0_g1_i1:68-4312(+)
MNSDVLFDNSCKGGTRLIALSGVPDSGVDTLADSLAAKIGLNDVSRYSFPTASIAPRLDVHRLAAEGGGLFDTMELRNSSTVLRSVDVSVKIVEYCAEVEITQTYLNDKANPLEAVFIFPMDERAAVCGFEAAIGEKRIRGSMRLKQQAQSEYSDSIAMGHGAYLLEQETDSIFKASIGNIPSGSAVEISIKYVSHLDLHNGVLEFSLPNTISKQIQNHFSGDGDGEKIANYTFSMVFRAEMRSPILAVKLCNASFSDEILSGNLFDGTLFYKGVQLPSDIKVNIRVEDPHKMRAWVEQHPEDECKAIMLAFYPQEQISTPPESVFSEFIFLIDRSGSMSGRRIEDAKATLLHLLDKLPKQNAKFNIVSFGSNFEKFSKSVVMVSPDNLESARKHVRAMSANLGGTNLLQPMEFIFQQPPTPGYSRQVFVITDGDVSNKDQVLRCVYTQADTTRVFSFGIGSAADANLINGLASAGSGHAEFVKADLELETIVERQLIKSLRPSLTRLQIDWGDLEVESTVPNRIPPLFSGERLIVFAFLKRFHRAGDCEVKLKGIMGGGKEVCFSAVFDPSRVNSKGTVIQALAARAMIKELEENFEGKEVPTISQKVTELSLRYCLMSKYTSFLGIEKRTDASGETMSVEKIITGSTPPTNSVDLHFSDPQIRRYTDVREERDYERIRLVDKPVIPLLFRSEKSSRPFGCYLLNVAIDERLKDVDLFRLCDGVVIVTDPMSPHLFDETKIMGFSMNQIKMCLFVNQLDKMLLQMEVDQVTEILQKVIDSANSFPTDSLIQSSFSPVEGNVVFGSGLMRFSFSVRQFAKMYSDKFGKDVEELNRKLWSHYLIIQRGGSVKFTVDSHSAEGIPHQRAFAALVLKPIQTMIKACVERNRDDVSKYATKLNLPFKNTWFDKYGSNRLTKKVMSKWLGVETGLGEMIVDFLPSPKEAQIYRYRMLYEGPSSDQVAEGIRSCDPNGPLVVYVGKVVETTNKNRAMSVGRVFSGTLKSGDEVAVLGGILTKSRNRRIQGMISMQDSDIHDAAMSRVTPGNIFGFGDGSVSSRSTLLGNNLKVTDLHPIHVPLLRNERRIFKAEVETSPQRLSELIEAFRRLIRVDPTILLTYNDTGLHVISSSTLENLHWAIDFVRKGISSELTIREDVELRETVSAKSDRICMSKSPNKHSRIWMNAEPTPQDLTSQQGIPEIPRSRIWSFFPSDEESDCPINVLVDTTKGVAFLNEIKDSVVTAFQMVANCGVLTSSPLTGVRFNVVDVTMTSDAIHRGPGQFIPTSKRVMYATQLTSSPRLMEAVMRVKAYVSSGVEEITTFASNHRCETEIVQSSHWSANVLQVSFLVSASELGNIMTELSIARFRPYESEFSHWRIINADPLKPGTNLNKFVNNYRTKQGLGPIPSLDRFMDTL